MNFSDFLTEYEQQIRLSCFFSILILIAIWELLAPRRALTISKTIRWVNNLGLVFFNSIVVWLVLPIAAVGVANFAQHNSWGLFNSIDVAYPIAIIGSIVLLDLAIYLQHVMVHAIPLFWRLHRVHHADLDYDVTTGSRFHTLEILFSALLKFALILLIGPPLVAVILFEIILNAASMFNHGNIRLPKSLDKLLRLLIVTPDMHRVHHSIEDDETNSNFGFNLSIWDRIFGTYRAQPRAGHKDMTIGIRSMREIKKVAWLPGMLQIPFIGKVTDYSINRREWHEDTKL